MVSPDSSAPVHVLRIGAVAWDAALDAVASCPAGDVPVVADHVAGEPTGAADLTVARAELTEATIATDSGVIVEPWAAAIRQVLAPQILLHLTGIHAGISGDVDVSLSGGRALAVYRPRRAEIRPDGSVAHTAYATEVELSFFAEADLWDGLARLLPDLDQFRAGAVNVVDVLDESIIDIPAPVAEAVRAVLADSTDVVDPAEMAAIDGAPDALVDVIARREASLTAAMTTTAGARRSLWAGVWAVADGQLYSIRADASRHLMTLARVKPGNVANELAFALAGAHDFRRTAPVPTQQGPDAAQHGSRSAGEPW